MLCIRTNKLNDSYNYTCVFFSVVESQPVTPVTLWLFTLFVKSWLCWSPSAPLIQQIYSLHWQHLFRSTTMVKSMSDTHSRMSVTPPQQLVTQFNYLVLASHLSPMGHLRAATVSVNLWASFPQQFSPYPKFEISVPWHTTQCLAGPPMTNLSLNHRCHAELLVLNMT